MTRPVSGEESKVRYRLRFLLQEFDMSEGTTVIGRDTECHITIYDPLISRRHAEVRCTASCAIMQDLGSRNGTRINGIVIRGTYQLREGDRIRIGAQELVFSEHEGGLSDMSRRTGLLCRCSACRTIYPEEMRGCPNCGCAAGQAEDTRTEEQPSRLLETMMPKPGPGG